MFCQAGHTSWSALGGERSWSIFILMFLTYFTTGCIHRMQNLTLGIYFRWLSLAFLHKLYLSESNSLEAQKSGLGMNNLHSENRFTSSQPKTVWIFLPHHWPAIILAYLFFLCVYLNGIKVSSNLMIFLLQIPIHVLESLRNLAFCEKLVDLSWTFYYCIKNYFSIYQDVLNH